MCIRDRIPPTPTIDDQGTNPHKPITWMSFELSQLANPAIATRLSQPPTGVERSQLFHLRREAPGVVNQKILTFENEVYYSNDKHRPIRGTYHRNSEGTRELVIFDIGLVPPAAFHAMLQAIQFTNLTITLRN